MAALVGVASLACSSARALDLTWSAPASCPTQQVVQQRIDALIGTPRETQPVATQTVSAAASVTESRDGYKLKLALHGGEVSGTRSLTGRDCAALAETAAFLVAVAIDPSLPGTQPAPARASEPVASSAQAPAAAPPVAPALEALARRRTGILLHASGFGGVWTAGLPAPQVQLGAALGAQLGRLRAELRGSYLAVRARPLALMPRPGVVELSSSTLEAAACWVWGEDMFAGPCASVAAVRSVGDGREFLRDEKPVLWWGSASLGAEVGLRLTSWLDAFAEAGSGIALSPRPRFRARAASNHIDGNKWSAYGRVGVRFRWQPTWTSRDR